MVYGPLNNSILRFHTFLEEPPKIVYYAFCFFLDRLKCNIFLIVRVCIGEHEHCCVLECTTNHRDFPGGVSPDSRQGRPQVCLPAPPFDVCPKEGFGLPEPQFFLV